MMTWENIYIFYLSA